MFKEKYFNDFIKLNRGFDLPNDKIIEGEYPVVASTEIKAFHKTFKVKAPGVVTGRSGSLGTVQYVSDNYWPLNTALYVKDFKGNDPKFVYYFLQTMHLENFNAGAGVPSLNQNHLHKQKIIVPDDANQQNGIASILSAYDDLIEVNNQRIKLLEETARELYKEWFVRMRFPGHKEAKFVKGVPQGWEVKELKSISFINKSNLNSKSQVVEINYIDISSVTTGRIELSTYYLTKDAPGRAKRVLQNEDTIFATVRPENKAFAFVVNPKQNTIASTGFAVLSPKELYFSTFVYSIVSSDIFADEMSLKAKGSAYPQVGFDDIAMFKILLPDKGVVKKYYNISKPMFYQIETLIQQNTQLRQIRDRLLPRLISGKLELK